MTASTTPAASIWDRHTLRGAAATRPRPPRAGPLSASLTFAGRALLKIKHVPEQLADAIMIPILFTVMFTYLFGGALAGSTSDYLQFLLPGTLVFAVLLITVYAGVNINTDISKGVTDRFRSMPIWRPALVVGGLISDAARNLLAATLVARLALRIGSLVYPVVSPGAAWFDQIEEQRGVQRSVPCRTDSGSRTCTASIPWLLPGLRWALVPGRGCI